VADQKFSLEIPFHLLAKKLILRRNLFLIPFSSPKVQDFKIENGKAVFDDH